MDILNNVLSIFMFILILSSICLVHFKKFKFSEGIIFSSLSVILVFLVKIFLHNHIYKTDIISDFINNLIATVESVLKIAYTESEGALPPLDITQIKNMYVIYFPSLLIIYSVMVCWIIHTTSKLLLKLFKSDISHYPSFAEYKYPKSALWVLTLTYLASLLIKNQTILTALQNINLLLMFYAFFCGLSCFDFFFRKKLKYTVLRVMIYIVFFMFFGGFGTIAFMILIFTALTDSIFNIRKLNDEVQNG